MKNEIMNLGIQPNDIGEADAKDPNDLSNYAEKIGFLNDFTFRAKVYTNKEIPHLNIQIYPYNHLIFNKNYVINCTPSGILFEGIKYDFNYNDNNDEGYEYTCKNGFIDSQYINNIQADNHGNLIFVTDNEVEFKITIPNDIDINEIIKIYKHKPTSSYITAIQNWFDLEHDPTFAQMEMHVTAFKADNGLNPTDNNLFLIKLKARYLPNFHNNIFQNSIHISHIFIGSLESNGLFLMGLKAVQYGLFTYYFLNKSRLFINNSQIINSAIETKENHYSQVIITTNKYIVRLMLKNRINSLMSKSFDFPLKSQLLNQYIQNNLNPISINSLNSRRFINTNYQHIAQQYLKVNNHTNYKFNLKDLLAIKIASVYFAIWYLTMFGYNNIKGLLFLSSHSTYCYVLYLFLIPILFEINNIAWCTYYHSQVINNHTAIILTILSATYIICSAIYLII